MKGIIFDFNGTLYWDSQLHYDAWIEYSKILRGTSFTKEEMRDKMFGHTNADIIEYAIGRKPSVEMVEKYAKEKDYMESMGILNEAHNVNPPPSKHISIPSEETQSSQEDILLYAKKCEKYAQEKDYMDKLGILSDDKL